MPSDQLVREVTGSLLRRFGTPTLGNKRNPFSELVYIVLSTRTPPESYRTTYSSIRRAFPSWEQLADAHLEDIEDAIVGGGLQRKKAEQLKGIATRARQSFGRVTLAPLKAMNDADAERFLLGLPGVGVKAARCVLMYSLNRDLFPVDTHCVRVVRRLGWIDSGRSLDRRLADEIQSLIPGRIRKHLHVGMILLGRSICLPKSPSCPSCPILRFCLTGNELMRADLAHWPIDHGYRLARDSGEPQAAAAEERGSPSIE